MQYVRIALKIPKAVFGFFFNKVFMTCVASYVGFVGGIYLMISFGMWEWLTPSPEALTFLRIITIISFLISGIITLAHKNNWEF